METELEKPHVVVREVAWESDGPAMASVRRRVFIEEQQVPEDLELDGLDPGCRHVVAFDGDGEVVGTGRLLPDGHIGRVAVLRGWRGRGVGVALMRALIKAARKAGMSSVELNSQTQALGFYEALGFLAFGDEFMEAGIPHRAMRLNLEKDKVTEE